MPEALLCASALTRRFGGVLAVDRVSLRLMRGAIHAVIGTNGAGKSTLINLLAGELAPSSGTIELFGAEVTATRAHQRARLGIGRTFQRSNVFAEFSAFENCRLAAQARRPRPWALHEPAAGCAKSAQAAAQALSAVALSARQDSPAGLLSHGERRELEIAMCLATEPTVLLLDEPLAGLDGREAQRVLELLQRLKPQRAILLVEHDMDAVFAVADAITVMVGGAVLAAGAPQSVRSNAAVREAYLGEAI